MLVRNIILFLLCATLSSCDLGGSSTTTVPFVTELDVWVPTGSGEENRLLQQQAMRFNQSQEKVRINMVILPPGDYIEQLRIASAKQALPDMMRMPAEGLYTYAWLEQLLPLDKLLTDTVSKDLLPIVLRQGMYQGRLYGVAPLINRPVLYARRSQIPSSLEFTETMSYNRFSELLASLSRQRDSRAVLEIKPPPLGMLALMNMSWPQDELTVTELQQQDGLQGLFKQAALIQTVQIYQQWLGQGYISSDTHSAFMTGSVPLLLASQREAQTLQDQWQEDLMILPAPHGARQQPVLVADWFWSLRRHGEKQAAAIRYLEFLLRPDEITLMAQASSLLPATVTGWQASGHENFDEVLDQAGRSPVLRTPAYAELKKTFDTLFQQLTAVVPAVEVLQQSHDAFRRHWFDRQAAMGQTVSGQVRTGQTLSGPP